MNIEPAAGFLDARLRRLRNRSRIGGVKLNCPGVWSVLNEGVACFKLARATEPVKPCCARPFTIFDGGFLYQWRELNCDAIETDTCHGLRIQRSI
ncbi:MULTISPECIES: hypothetical protein [unclassified Rhizobium]|uniref:hypothetical protein n=1 Tax=unclassified Rhizobium TaxID=2613769 RepID=UPI0014957CE6|nr:MULTISPECIES: hypothetical protein [unclassified Rhizobium]